MKESDEAKERERKQVTLETLFGQMGSVLSEDEVREELEKHNWDATTATPALIQQAHAKQISRIAPLYSVLFISFFFSIFSRMRNMRNKTSFYYSLHVYYCFYYKV